MAKVSTLVFAVLVAAGSARGDVGTDPESIASPSVEAGFSRDAADRPPVDWAAAVEAVREDGATREADSPALGLIGIGISGLIALRRFRKFFS